jgi:integrase
VIQGIRRSLGTAPAQKEAVLTPTLRRLVASCDPKTRVGARDRALLLLGFGAALRRSELVALDTDDVTVTDEGLRIRIRRSKTDPEAHGDEVGVVKGQHPDIDPVRALQNWLHLGGITAGPLFRPVTRADTVRRGRLSGQTVALIVQRTAQRAGLPAPEAFAGHSLRSGCATQAAVEGAPERAIMRQGRWRSSAPVRRYIRTGDLWQENASAWLGL